MSEGVPILDPEAAKPDDQTDSDSEYCAINPPVSRERKKDLKSRRKAREEKMKHAARQLSKIELRKVSDIYRYGAFLSVLYYVCIELICSQLMPAMIKSCKRNIF